MGGSARRRARVRHLNAPVSPPCGASATRSAGWWLSPSCSVRRRRCRGACSWVRLHPDHSAPGGRPRQRRAQLLTSRGRWAVRACSPARDWWPSWQPVLGHAARELCPSLPARPRYAVTPPAATRRAVRLWLRRLRLDAAAPPTRAALADVHSSAAATFGCTKQRPTDGLAAVQPPWQHLSSAFCLRRHSAPHSAEGLHLNLSGLGRARC